MSTKPNGKLATNVACMLERIEQMCATQGVVVTEITIDYVELGEYAGEQPAPRLLVKFSNSVIAQIED